MSQPQKIRLTLPPEAERFVRRDAPVGVRRMAAGGALPLGPVEIATVLFALLHDPDDEVKTRARESLENLPEGVRDTVLAGETHPAILSLLAQVHRDQRECIEKIALNPATDDRTFVYLAALPHKRVVEIVANNQERLLRCPEIVDTLGENPLTGRATIDRILSFLGIDRHAAEEAEEADGGGPVDLESLTDADAIAALRAVLGDDTDGFAAGLVDDGVELDSEEENSLFALVQKMTVMQKVKLARLGNKEARGLLVRDRNKIVATAAIRSPKITENEVEGYAKARNVSDDVLRIIAHNREWTKNYMVKLGLATNPKCPIPQAMRFVNFLQERDLKVIMRSKDVPSAIASHARRLLQKKGKI